MFCLTPSGKDCNTSLESPSHMTTAFSMLPPLPLMASNYSRIPIAHLYNQMYIPTPSDTTRSCIWLFKSPQSAVIFVFLSLRTVVRLSFPAGRGSRHDQPTALSTPLRSRHRDDVPRRPRSAHRTTRPGNRPLRAGDRPHPIPLRSAARGHRLPIHLRLEGDGFLDETCDARIAGGEVRHR